MDAPIRLAPGAEDNGLAVMLTDLVRQNVEAHPDKLRDFVTVASGRRPRRVAIVADDAEIALTLRFADGTATVHDGIDGIPDLTIRADSDVIVALSNLPARARDLFQDGEGRRATKLVVAALRSGRLRLHGALFHVPLLLRFSRVMAV